MCSGDTVLLEGEPWGRQREGCAEEPWPRWLHRCLPDTRPCLLLSSRRGFGWCCPCPPAHETPQSSRRRWGQGFSYLHQGHLGAEGQQNLLGLGGVGVVAVLVEPLLERPRHVLQRLPLVPHLPAALPRPAAEKGRSGGRRAPARPPPRPGHGAGLPRVREACRDARPAPGGTRPGGGEAAPAPGCTLPGSGPARGEPDPVLAGCPGSSHGRDPPPGPAAQEEAVPAARPDSRWRVRGSGPRGAGSGPRALAAGMLRGPGRPRRGDSSGAGAPPVRPLSVPMLAVLGICRACGRCVYRGARAGLARPRPPTPARRPREKRAAGRAAPGASRA